MRASEATLRQSVLKSGSSAAEDENGGAMVPYLHFFVGFKRLPARERERERERERGAAFPSRGAMRAGEREREREREKRERVRKDDQNSFHTHIYYRLACFLWFTLDQSFFHKLRDLQEQEGQH